MSSKCFIIIIIIIIYFRSINHINSSSENWGFTEMHDI